MTPTVDSSQILFSSKVIFLIVLSLIGGFIVGLIFFRLGIVGLDKANVDYFYDNQSAAVSGQITSINGKIITFRNKKNISRKLEIADQIAIMKPTDLGVPPKISTKISDIELNKEVSIILNVVNGSLFVTTVNYNPINSSIPTPNTPVPPPPKNILLPPAESTDSARPPFPLPSAK